jgi:hypothetical protein
VNAVFSDAAAETVSCGLLVLEPPEPDEVELLLAPQAASDSAVAATATATVAARPLRSNLDDCWLFLCVCNRVGQLDRRIRVRPLMGASPASSEPSIRSIAAIASHT